MEGEKKAEAVKISEEDIDFGNEYVPDRFVLRKPFLHMFELVSQPWMNKLHCWMMKAIKL